MWKAGSKHHHHKNNEKDFEKDWIWELVWRKVCSRILAVGRCGTSLPVITCFHHCLHWEGFSRSGVESKL